MISKDSPAKKRTAKNLTIRMEGQSKPFVVEILAINEFSSDRKSMSVVVRLPDGTVRMYCKGADSVIRERLTPGQSIVDITWQHLEVVLKCHCD
jgi:phospholipid-transporting ATPase